jgi:hypothetical protein
MLDLKLLFLLLGSGPLLSFFFFKFRRLGFTHGRNRLFLGKDNLGFDEVLQLVHVGALIFECEVDDDGSGAEIAYLF